jgi:hypothetical protein
MNKLLLILILFFASLKPLLSQDNKEALEDLTRKFSNFEYAEVIKNASQLIKDKNQFTRLELIEIYRMKGIAHYSMLDEQQARLSFLEILKVDSSYVLDPSNTSPKIISFFDKVKGEYLVSVEGKQDNITIVKHDTIYVPVIVRDTLAAYRLRQALLPSLFIPGLGHLYLESNLKSWALTTLSVASIVTGIFYIIDTNKKEKEYLQETDIGKVSEKYNKYNFSFRTRNLAFISYIALWLYCQLDLLFDSDYDESGALLSSYLPGLKLHPYNGISLTYKIKL